MSSTALLKRKESARTSSASLREHHPPRQDESDRGAVGRRLQQGCILWPLDARPDSFERPRLTAILHGHP
jgi:hypothetical protein